RHGSRGGGGAFPGRRGRYRGRDLRVPARSSRGDTVMEDVAIIGVGMHPFGRFPGKSAIEMAAEAVRAACADAGVRWHDVQFAFGGSFEVDNPDAVTGLLGLTGIPFMDVYNGCATAATALELTADAIRAGKYDLGV